MFYRRSEREVRGSVYDPRRVPKGILRGIQGTPCFKCKTASERRDEFMEMGHGSSEILQSTPSVVTANRVERMAEKGKTVEAEEIVRITFNYREIPRDRNA